MRRSGWGLALAMAGGRHAGSGLADGSVRRLWDERYEYGCCCEAITGATCLLFTNRRILPII